MGRRAPFNRRTGVGKYTASVIRYPFLALGLTLLLPGNAYAYLDPGTGNILVYAAISLIGALAFVIRGAAYKIGKLLGLSHARTAASAGAADVVIFSESKAYWFSFKPVVEALLRENIPFRYLSMDIDDPGLTIEHHCMLSRYVGQGSAAYARVCAAKGRVMLATTPNIGTPGYPMPKPRHIECLAHIFHGPGCVDTYKKYALDEYDAVLLTHPCFEASVRHLERLRGLPAKECAAVGLPYLDVLAEHRREFSRSEPFPGNRIKTVLLAPSWGEKGSLVVCGSRIVPQLLEAGYEVILRPHPQSRAHEPEILDAILSAYTNESAFTFDFSVDASPSMEKAALLISDKSGIRFDFALLYGKPVITLDVPFGDRSLYEASDLESLWEDEISPIMGPVLAVDGDADIRPAVAEALAANSANLQTLRDRFVVNFGCSGTAVAKWAITKCEHGKRP